MLVVNFFGASCTGKSTHASALYSELKKQGVKVELVREYCKNFFYEGTQYKLSNQMLITGKQIEQTEMFRRGGCDVVITDSPILLGAFYVDDNKPLAEAIRAEHYKNDNYNIRLHRDVQFDSFGRSKNQKHSDEITELLDDECLHADRVCYTTQLTDYTKIAKDIQSRLDTIKCKHRFYSVSELSNVLCLNCTAKGTKIKEEIKWKC